MPLNTTQPKIKLSSDKESQLYVDGFAGGLNTLVSPQHIADNECSILLNADIAEDGVITRRAGTAYYDSGSDGSRVFGLYPFTTYDGSGTRTSTLLKMDDAGHLKKLSAGSWSTISGFTYTTGQRTEFAQSQTLCYLCNGKDPLSYTDGSTISTYATITNPSGAPTLATSGTAGTTSYTYAYTLVSAHGETAASPTATITTGNATLSSTNYNTVTMTRSSDSNVTGYNVYGRGNGYQFYLGFVAQTSSGNPVFNDTGAAYNGFFQAPVANTTNGQVGSITNVYHDTLFIAGDPANGSLLHYSAGLDKFDSFQLVDGGGSILINAEDGDVITGVISFKDKQFVFKNRSIYMFNFNPSGPPTVTVVNPEVGCTAPRTIKVVLNDVYFLNRTGVYTLGYQEGYYGVGVADLLRANGLSYKINNTLGTINQSAMRYAAAVHTISNFKYILAYPDGSSPVNNKIVCFDTRYNAWVQWDNLSANCFAIYYDANNVENVLYGDDGQGRVIQLFSGTSDRGGSFTFRMQTKDFNEKAFQLTKTWIWPTIHFRNILGNFKLTYITDGITTYYQTTVAVAATSAYLGWSYDKWSTVPWSSTAGVAGTATAADAPRQLNQRFDSRSLMFLIENTSTSDVVTVLGVQSRTIVRAGRRLDSSFLLS